MCSNVWDDNTDFEVCVFTKTWKSKYLGNALFHSQIKKYIHFVMVEYKELRIYGRMPWQKKILLTLLSKEFQQTIKRMSSKYGNMYNIVS